MNAMPRNLMIAAAAVAASWTMTESANAQYCGSRTVVHRSAPAYYSGGYYSGGYAPVVQVVERPVYVTRPRYYSTYRPVYRAPHRTSGFSVNFNYSSRDRHHGNSYRRGHSRRGFDVGYSHHGRGHHSRGHHSRGHRRY